MEDTADAYLTTIRNNNISGETINLGNNFEVSIKSILKILKKILVLNLMLLLTKKN